jgi:hypothetical protein
MLLRDVIATFAILYDIHGNLPALEAVLDDARGAGAEVYLLGGDYALFGPWPAETVAALQALPDAIWIRGNVDRWTAFPEGVPAEDPAREAIAACRAELGDQLAAAPAVCAPPARERARIGSRSR